MTDPSIAAMIPESTYHFSAEFEPSHLGTWFYYIIMGCIAAFVLMLIVDREIVDEDGFCEREIASEGYDCKAGFRIEDRGCQSPGLFAGYRDFEYGEEERLERSGV